MFLSILDAETGFYFGFVSPGHFCSLLLEDTGIHLWSCSHTPSLSHCHDPGLEGNM